MCVTLSLKTKKIKLLSIKGHKCRVGGNGHLILLAPKYVAIRFGCFLPN